MDCLFTDKEFQAMDVYIKMIHESLNKKAIIYASPDFQFYQQNSWLNMQAFSSMDINNGFGFLGMYKGADVYSFNGMDTHTCCIVPAEDKWRT